MIKRILVCLLAAAAIAVLLFRLANLDLASFILDEPQFLDAARGQLSSGHWRNASPIVGTQGLRYGPTVFWFYGLVHAVFGPGARTSIAAMCLLLVVSHFALAWGLSRALQGGLALFGAVLVWIASSPYQFFWSRLAWDQMANVCTSWAVFILCLPTHLTWPVVLPLGLVLGLGISSHLMVVPFVAAVFAVGFIELRGEPKRLFGILTLLMFGIFLANVPYLTYVTSANIQLNPSPGFSIPILGEYLLQPVRAATTWGIEYFFDQDWPDFVAWLGTRSRLYWTASAALVFVAIVAASGVLLALRHPAPQVRRIALLALVVWIGAPIYFASRSIDRHPHYQFATWWIVPFGIASALCWSQQRWKPLFGVLASGCAVVVVSNVAFNLDWMAYIRERGGTRGIHYSTPIGLQEQAILAICAVPSSSVQVENRTILWPFPIQYGVSTESSCNGKQINICPAGTCPPLAEGEFKVSLAYASDRGGALKVE
jgi:hypothetical protein